MLSIRDKLQAAEEQSQLFNSREALFGRAVTEYGELSSLKKEFEPYGLLWSTFGNWLIWKRVMTFELFFFLLKKNAN